MSDMKYTPDTLDVKVAYCSSFDSGFAHRVMAQAAAEMMTGHAGDFDRWLKQIQAQAWQAGAEAVALATLPGAEPLRNPYRDATTEEPT